MINFSAPDYTVSTVSSEMTWENILRLGFSQDQTFILTSHLPEDKRSQHDIIALYPLLHFTVFINRIEVSFSDGRKENLTSSPFLFLDELCKNKSDDGLKSGGIFLAFAYEFSALIEPTKKITKPIDDQTPLLVGMIPSTIFVRHIHSGVIEQISTQSEIVPIQNSTAKIVSNQLPVLTKFESALSDAEYKRKVNQLKANIFNGETYELNFAYQTNGEFSHQNDFAVWNSLNRQSPSSFFSYFRNKDFSVISSSPERFFILQNNNLTVQPMKGTRKRIEDSKSKAIIDELKSNEKDRAENLMIVDLMRNDLSKISQPESVIVENLFEVETYKTVYQMISTISCKVKPNTSFSEIIRALYPPGSMTGAPKIKTMEIIAEIEQFRRGFYSGICGYFSFGGTAEFSVLIRCLEISETEFKANFGGAIVADSVADNELEETKAKMLGILKSLG